MRAKCIGQELSWKQPAKRCILRSRLVPSEHFPSPHAYDHLLFHCSHLSLKLHECIHAQPAGLLSLMPLIPLYQWGAYVWYRKNPLQVGGGAGGTDETLRGEHPEEGERDHPSAEGGEPAADHCLSCGSQEAVRGECLQRKESNIIFTTRVQKVEKPQLITA